MIKIGKFCRFIKYNHLPIRISSNLTTRLVNNFTLIQKKNQLILHTEGDI
jgi:hypothetical protein